MMNHSNLQSFKSSQTPYLRGDFGHIHFDGLGLKKWKSQIQYLPEILRDVKSWIDEFDGYQAVLFIELDDSDTMTTECPELIDAIKFTRTPPGIFVEASDVLFARYNIEEYWRVLPPSLCSGLSLEGWKPVYRTWRPTVVIEGEFRRSIFLYSG